MFTRTNHASGRLLARLLAPMAGGLLLVAAGWTFLATSTPAPRARGAAAASQVSDTGPAATAPISDRLRHRWSPGRELRYRYHSVSSVSLQAAGTSTADILTSRPRSAADEEFLLRADLVLRVIRMEGEEAIVALRLSDCEVAHKRGGDPVTENARSLLEGLQIGWMARITAQGVVQSLEFPPDTDPLCRNRLRAVLSGIQIVLPERDANTWVAAESDLFGRFEAEYSSGPTDRDGVVEILRHRRCVEAHGSAGVPVGLAPELTTEGETRAAFDTREGIVRELRGRETIVISGPELPLRARCSVERHIVLVAAGVAASAAPEGSEGWVRGDGLAAERVEPVAVTPASGADAQGEAGRSFDAAFGDALRLSKAADWEQAAIPMWMEFSEMFRRDPSSVARAVEVLSSKTPLDPRTCGLLIDALGKAGTAEAQAALFLVLRRAELAPEVRALALYAAVSVESPTEESLQGILDLADDSGPLAECVLTGMGIAASKGLERGDLTTADAILSRIERALDASTDASQRRGAILGLGNAGSASSLPTLLREAESADETLREAAAFALRKMPRAAAVPRLERLLTLDPSEEVRRAARESLDALSAVR